MSPLRSRPSLLALLLGSGVLLSAQPAADLVVRDVRVVHGDGRVTPRAAIVVRAGRISAVSVRPVARVGPARVIDGRGRTLIPGLVDAHVHVTAESLPRFLRYGVTTVRDLHNDPAYVLPLAVEDSPAHPRIVAAGGLIDGPGTLWPNALPVETVAGARTAVREAARHGAGVISVSARLPPAVLDVIVQEARARGVPVAAHLGRTTAREAALSGVASLEHLSGIPEALAPERHRLQRASGPPWSWRAALRRWPLLSPAALDELNGLLREHSVALVPTLVLYEALAGWSERARHGAVGGIEQALAHPGWSVGPEPSDSTELAADAARALPSLQRFVAAYARAGGRVVAGTNAPNGTVPGASLHRELQLYVAAGLPPAAALRTATIDAAELLGVADRTGSIDPGKDADFVLLREDPLRDIGALSRIETVVRGGVVHAASAR